MSVARALSRLLMGLLIPFTVSLYAPRPIPPGNVWSRGDTLATVALLTGAFAAGRVAFSSLSYFAYGVAGGACIGLVFLPDSNQVWRIAYGGPPFSDYLKHYYAAIAACGLLGVIAGKCGAMTRGRDECSVPTCRACGYNLTGNISGTCPECGTGVTCENDPEGGESA